MKMLFSSYKYYLVGLLTAGTFVFTGCDKKDDNTTTPASTVPPNFHIELTHLAGNKQFFLDSTYTNENGDDFTVTLFKYYLSNIRLVKTDNSIVTVPDSYFLIDQSDDATMSFEMDSLPEGEFKAIRFIIGVDSAANTSGAQSGALDITNGMFWTWNTGYIFMKMEGTSPSIASPGNFRYHVGGFQGTYNNIKDVELDFNGTTMTLENGGNPELHLVLDVLEIFKNPVTIDMSTFSSTVMSANADAQTLANNYADMIRYDHIHQE